ncbi:MAG TPA: hypothetical protein VN577_06380 [Terriglobales bacterium]|nr:hypothetical protein [Terriglobales bacterium]
MTITEEARVRWLADKDRFEEFGKELKKILSSEIKKLGIWSDVTSRPKEMDSLIRKLVKKPKYTYDTLGDKVGVRVTVRYRSEIPRILAVAEACLNCGEWEDKLETLEERSKANEWSAVGYLSVHGDVRLKETAEAISKYPSERYHAELQVRTLAQHLWSEMSHDSFYKADEHLVPIPPAIKRRVNLMSGLIEVSDMEFDRVNAELPSVPEFRMLLALERHYYSLASEKVDRELSLTVIKLLLPLYSSDIASTINHLDEFFSDHFSTLQVIFDEERANPNRAAFLFTPESLMIYDRLEADDVSLRKCWMTALPEKELELVANRFGFSFD